MRVPSGLPINTCTHVFSYTYVPTLAHACVHAHTHTHTELGQLFISFVCLHFGKNWEGSSHHLCALGLRRGCSSRLKKAHPMLPLVSSSSTAWISPYIGFPFCKGYYNQQTSKFPARWTSVQSILQTDCGTFQTSCVRGMSQLTPPPATYSRLPFIHHFVLLPSHSVPCRLVAVLPTNSSSLHDSCFIPQEDKSAGALYPANTL